MKSVLLTLVFMVGALAAQAIDLSISFNAPTCHGYSDGTITANPTGGAAPYSYAWSNGQSGQTALGVTGGTYAVTVTDQTGATVSGNITVTEPAAIVVTFAQNAPNCNSFQPVTANVSGGTGTYSFAWSSGHTTASITPSGSGNVFVTVTDAAGCGAVATYYVPVASQIFTSYFATPPSCFGGNNGSITPTVFGNYGPHTWQWNTGTHNNTNLSGIVSGDYSITISDQQGCTKVDQINVPTQAPVQVLAQMTGAKCNGTASGVGMALASGGVNPYTYQWNTGQTSSIIENLPAGTYTVTITDGNNCSASASGVVTQPAPLTNTVIAITPACGNNGIVTVQPSGGTPPYNLIWNGGQYTGTTVSGLAPGNYYICTFDANHCQYDLNVVVPGGPGLSVTLQTEKAHCAGLNTGAATAVVSGGSGAYQYIWSNGAPNMPQLTGLPAGTTLAVTVVDLNTGCTGTATGAILAHGQIAISVTDSDAFCANDGTGSAQVTTLTGAAPFTYAWNVNGSILNTPAITGLNAGAYPVTVTDAQGCEAYGVADINATGNVVAQFVVETVLCDSNIVKIKLVDQSTTNGQPINSWQWTASWGTGSVQLNGQTPPVIEVPANSNGVVQLSVSNASGCTDQVLVPFEVGAAVVVNISGTSSFVNCSGGPSSIVVNGDPSYTYQWSPMTNLTFMNNNPQTVEANPVQNTNYQLIASKAGCFDTLNVQIVKPVPFEVDLGAPVITSCDPNQMLAATLSVPLNNLNIVWVNAAGDSIGTGNTYPVAATNTPVTYGVVVTDAYGCSDSDQVSVSTTSVDVQANIMPINSACAGAPVQSEVINMDSTDILVYNWTASPSGITFSDPVASNPTLSGNTGNYMISVTVTNQYGCTKTLSEPVEFVNSAALNGQVSADLCNGLNVAFSNTSGQVGEWLFGDGTTSNAVAPEHVYTTAGTYIVQFTPADPCYQPYKDTLQVNTVPAVVAAIESDLGNCQNTATLAFTDATQHVTQIATWNWSFSTGQQASVQNPTVIFPQEGIVTAILTVVDINGCSDISDTITLDIDIVTQNIDDITGICPGGSTALNPGANSAYDYNWVSTPADPELVSNNPNPTVSPDVNTNYAVTITNGTCSVVQNVALSIYEPADVLASRDTVVCNSNAVEISAFSTNASNFEWSTSPIFNNIFATGNVVMANPSVEGMNYVRATTAQGCPGMDSVMVLLGNPSVTASTLDPIYVCNGVSAQIGVINNNPNDILQYQWTGGLSATATQTVNPTTATNYTVVATNQYGCSETLNFTVSPVSLVLNLEVTGKTTICPGETAVITATTTGGSGYTYSWTPTETLDNPTIAAPTAAPVETTDYTVAVTDTQSGCTITGVTTITVISPECTDPFIFVPNAFTPNADDNNDFFRVRGINMTELYFVVWDRWGEKIYETEEVSHTGWDGTFKGVASSPDSYAWYARVRCGNGQIWEKKGNVTLLK